MINPVSKHHTGATTTMQLTFLGKSYKASTPDIETTLTGETATFMGKSYTRRQFTVAQRQQPAELTYRGIHYSR